MLHLYYLLELFSEKQIKKSSVDTFWKERSAYMFEKTFFFLTGLPLVITLFMKTMMSGVADDISKDQRTWISLLSMLALITLFFGLCFLLRKRTKVLRINNIKPSIIKAISFLIIYYLVLTLFYKIDFKDNRQFIYRFEKVGSEVIMKKDTTWRYYYDTYFTTKSS